MTILSTLFFTVLIFSLNYYINNELNLLQIFTFLALLITLVLIRNYNQDYSYYAVVSLIFIFSLFFVLFEYNNIQKKEQITQKQLIDQLANERDEMAERFLREINDRLVNDTILINQITTISINQDIVIHDYLVRKYFYGFWEKYDISQILCGNSELYKIENQAANCQGYFNEKFNNFGENVENTNFWFLNDKSGKIIYTGVINVPTAIDKRELTLYITLNEKLISKSLGYPKLLIDKSTLTNSEYENYSYAKYNNGILSVKSGKYFYDLIDKDFENNTKKPFYTEINGYNHLVLSNKTGQQIILSKEKIKVFDLIISFAYLFVLYNILVFISILFSDYRFALKKLRFDFTNQLRFAMIFI